MSESDRAYDSYAELLTIGAGGFLGAVSRYLISGQLPGPSGTLVANVLGSMLLGFLMYNSEYLGYVNPRARMFFGVGFMGSLTTFSTFTVQSYQMSPAGSLLNITLNILLTITGVFAGRGVVVYLKNRRIVNGL